MARAMKIRRVCHEEQQLGKGTIRGSVTRGVIVDAGGVLAVDCASNGVGRHCGGAVSRRFNPLKRKGVY